MPLMMAMATESGAVPLRWRGRRVQVGKLEAFGEWRCVLTANSDMCGDYDDVLHCHVSSDTGELPPQRVPVRVSITGSPLVVQKNRVEAVGMFALSNSMLLDFRSLVAGEPPVLKTFHVQNPCPYGARASTPPRRSLASQDRAPEKCIKAEACALPAGRSLLGMAGTLRRRASWAR